MAMNELDPTRAALLALDFQNYGVHPQGYWASHGEPDWPAIARPAVDSTAKVLAAARAIVSSSSTSGWSGGRGARR
jgi:nicotinamidase-related amidase